MRKGLHFILSCFIVLALSSLHARDNDCPVNSTAIQGEIELAVCFEVVPAGNFAIDLELWNPGLSVDSASIALRLELPDGRSRTLLTRKVTLGPGETFSRGFDRIVPDHLELYGRYTLVLLIDDLPVDALGFDLNSRNEIILRWDNGELTFPGAWYDSGNIWAVRGCMPEGAIIDEVGARLIAENDPFWPWPDAVHQAVELQIWDDGGPGGLPGNLLWRSGEVYVDPSDGEVTAFPGISAPPGTFYIGNYQLTNYPNCEGQGQDSGLDYPDRMFARVSGEWQNAADLISGDLMIWAIGHMPTSHQITISNPPLVQ